MVQNRGTDFFKPLSTFSNFKYNLLTGWDDIELFLLGILFDSDSWWISKRQVHCFQYVNICFTHNFLIDFRFGAERVLLTAGLVWGLLTFWFQTILSLDMTYIVFARVLLGAAQGVHFPAIASISSRNLNTKDRSFFFSATTAGSLLS